MCVAIGSSFATALLLNMIVVPNDSNGIGSLSCHSKKHHFRLCSLVLQPDKKVAGSRSSIIVLTSENSDIIDRGTRQVASLRPVVDKTACVNDGIG